MADIQILGHISNIKFQQECILIFVDERKRGYKKQDGTIVEDKILSWKCIFSGNEKKRGYINKFFNTGMLVQVKGEVLPYAVEQGSMIDGYSVFVQTINVAAYPSNNLRIEKKMIKESQNSSTDTPDLERFEEPDF